MAELQQKTEALLGKSSKASKLGEACLVLGLAPELPSREVPRLVAAIKSWHAPEATSVALSGLSWIPKGSVSYLVAGVKRNPALIRLQSHLLHYLRVKGYHFRHTRPHLTLATRERLPRSQPVPPPDFGITLPLVRIAVYLIGEHHAKGFRKLGDHPLRQPAAFRGNVALCIVNPRHEVLLVQHREHSRGAWQFPQGGIDPGKTIASTIAQELKEELGITEFDVLSVKEKAYRYRWPKSLREKGSDPTKRGFVGQEQSIAIIRVSENRPVLVPDPREAERVQWVPMKRLVSSLSRVRRGLGRLVMVELERILQAPKPKSS